MAKKILFLGFKCLLDTRSGAAIQIRSLLETLVKNGFECQSLTSSFFDGQTPFPIETILGKQAILPSHKGKFFVVEHHGVRHHIFNTKASLIQNLTQEETNLFLKNTHAYLKRNKPDLVISYGGMPYDKQLQHLARQINAKMAFYLANATYTNASTFEGFDQIWSPSQFLCDYYYKKLGIQPKIMPTLLPFESFVAPDKSLTINKIKNRKTGFISYINPSLQKGATLFLQLYKIAQKQRKDWTFLLVEGRMSAKDFTKQFGIDITRMPNLWWLPNQMDIRTVYSRTSILLFPSFCHEAAGCCIAEAQLSGIPVLASNHAGIPAQMNGGGFLFDIPQRCRKDYRKMPTQNEVRPWFNVITQLMDNDQAYDNAVKKALKAGDHLHPDHVQKTVVTLVSQLFK